MIPIVIVIVILIVMLFGTAPFDFGNEPGSSDCGGPALALAATANGCGNADVRHAWPGSPSPARGCGGPDGSLLMEDGSGLVLVNPGSLAVRRVPFSPEAVRIVERGWNRLNGVIPARWLVERTSDDTGRRIAVYERQTGDTVFDLAFDRRIELSTDIVSLSGRFTVHVQANNNASEVMILDAQSGHTRRLGIPHDARLAAYAIGVAFSQGETCAAISMERVGGKGAETWLLDLESGVVYQLPVPDAFVVAWTRDQV